MNIYEATKEAMRVDGWIKRPWGNDGWSILVKPTDTGDACLICVANERGEQRKTPAKRWQPQAEDLIAEDWEIVIGEGDDADDSDDDDSHEDDQAED